jgi:hypothetical protein
VGNLWLVSSNFVWLRLAAQVTAWARECWNRQHTQVSRQVQLPPAAISFPANRFPHQHVDLVDPLSVSDGFTHLLMVVDYCNR